MQPCRICLLLLGPEPVCQQKQEHHNRNFFTFGAPDFAVDFVSGGLLGFVAVQHVFNCDMEFLILSGWRGGYVRSASFAQDITHQIIELDCC